MPYPLLPQAFYLLAAINQPYSLCPPRHSIISICEIPPPLAPSLPVSLSDTPHPVPSSPSPQTAPQSRHATTIIEFLLIYSSKMTSRLRPTAPSPHSSSGDFTSVLFSKFQPLRPSGLAVHS